MIFLRYGNFITTRAHSFRQSRYEMIKGRNIDVTNFNQTRIIAQPPRLQCKLEVIFKMDIDQMREWVQYVQGPIGCTVEEIKIRENFNPLVNLGPATILEHGDPFMSSGYLRALFHLLDFKPANLSYAVVPVTPLHPVFQWDMRDWDDKERYQGYPNPSVRHN